MDFIYHRSILNLLSMSAFLTLWYGLALFLNADTLPSPVTVAKVLITEIQSGQLSYHLSKTLYRLSISFSIAMLLGCAIGIVLGRHQKLNTFLDNWLVIFLNIPALVTIILCYVWFGLTETAAILAVVINKLPNVIVTIREGARSLDTELLDMAKCYRFSKSKTLRHVIWPQLHPFVMAATRSGLALIWKIVLVVEMLGRSDGMGYQLHLFFQLFDVASILAYTVAFITLIQGIELLILRPLDKHAQRWRR
ncbi:sulfonate ABC transporter, permease protein, putative [methanotrophic endosymbiont of Bathymodiolus azoricus (Menez Gwen)]|jgi:NitT/TauT family transport system permease protein|nr:sulfonate ABC transporter, permease protein, putative [methanotrophic endosymbiont of Bathymodiolus azoricus (Menez Gwen)]